MPEDNSVVIRDYPWLTLARAIEVEDSVAAETAVEELEANELARAISHLDMGQVSTLLELLGIESTAEALERISHAQAGELIGILAPSRAAQVLGELPIRDQADLLEAVDSEEAEEILDEMAVSSAESIRLLSTYPHDTAGYLMDPDFLAFESSTRLQEVARELQANAETYNDFQVQYLHVTKRGKLVGIVRLRDVLFHSSETSVDEIAITDVVTVLDNTPLDELVSSFADHHFLGIPVVDTEGTLLGVVHRASVEHAVAGQSENEYRKAQGIVGGEELRSLPMLTRARRRLSWLSVNVVLNVMAASVIAFYQDTLQAVIALAAFLPIVSDMSGCSGNQAVAVSMRELSLGIVTPRDAFHVWRKEIGIAVINGLALGLLLAGVAWLWQQNLYLSLVVGIALALNTAVAVSIGGVVPLLLRRLGLDPALASGPILTTVTDMSGFFLALSLATFWMSRIVG